MTEHQELALRYLAEHQELFVLQQDMRMIADQQQTLSGLVDIVIEDNHTLTLENRKLASEKSALLATIQELQTALKRIIAECAG